MSRPAIIKSILITFLLGLTLLLFQKSADFDGGLSNHEKDTLNWVSTTYGSLHIETYRNDSVDRYPNLVIVIHGDSPFGNPSYQYKMAEKIAKQNRNTIAVGILRPGYSDENNNRSDGIKGLTNGDNYTVEVITAIAETITKLKQIYNPAKSIVVGHSGGSAIAADLIALHPDIVNSAVLVSCPCNVLKWRAHMSKKQFLNPLWKLGVKSISPIEVADKIGSNTQIVVVIGEKDKTTPIEISVEYFERLITLDKNVSYISIADKDHEILFDDKVSRTITQIISE